MAKEEKVADEKPEDVAEIIATVGNEEPDEKQTELLNHWNEPTSED